MSSNHIDRNQVEFLAREAIIAKRNFWDALTALEVELDCVGCHSAENGIDEMISEFHFSIGEMNEITDEEWENLTDQLIDLATASHSH